jgi:hypothetical protein
MARIHNDSLLTARYGCDADSLCRSRMPIPYQMPPCRFVMKVESLCAELMPMLTMLNRYERHRYEMYAIFRARYVTMLRLLRRPNLSIACRQQSAGSIIYLQHSLDEIFWSSRGSPIWSVTSLCFENGGLSRWWKKTPISKFPKFPSDFDSMIFVGVERDDCWFWYGTTQNGFSHAGGPSTALLCWVRETEFSEQW